MDINYLVMNFSETNKIVWSDILETNINTMRKSNDGTLCVIKWRGETPAFVSTLDWKSPIYNKEEILVVLQSPEWTEPTPISGTTM